MCIWKYTKDRRCLVTGVVEINNIVVKIVN